MAVQLDDIHYDFRNIDGYDKTWNFIMSPRDDGKTSMGWLKKIYWPWKKNHNPWIYLTRQVVEINDSMIQDISDTMINKFTDDNVTFKYNKKFESGIVNVYVDDLLFFRIVSLSITLRRLKSAKVRNLAGVLMDEYIIDPRTDERYLNNEAFKIKEAYNTWRREAYNEKLKVYILANPYSLYNPLFMDWKVDVNKLKKDSFYVGSNFVIHWAILHPLLKKKLLEINPLYKDDEVYVSYALEGSAINDTNIKVRTLPDNFKLKYTFRVDGKYLGVFKNNILNIDADFVFFVKEVDVVSAKRVTFCYDFKELVDNTIIINGEDRLNLSMFKDGIRRNLVGYSNINMYYMIQEVYKNL